VLLLDEIEKAHQDIYNILLQVMDHATLTDNNGRKATSGSGPDHDVQRRLARDERRQHRLRRRHGGARQDAKSRAKSALERVFSPSSEPARRDRRFNALSFEDDGDDRGEVRRAARGAAGERRIAFALTPEARAWLARKGYDPVFGARPLARVVQAEVRDPLTDEILFGRSSRAAR